jgi:hypothetical protein
MATPHVTGIVSLLYSVNPALTPAQILQILQSTARAFPSGSTCNTLGCGAGIVDATAAVQQALYPALTGTNPHFVQAGSGGMTLTVNGANFLSNAQVKWNGASRTTNFIDPSQLQATIAAGDVAAAGSAQITVVETHPIYGIISANACTFGIMPQLGPKVYFFPFISAGQNPSPPAPGPC